MFLIVPYHVDVPMRCWPWMNWVLLGLTVLFFPLCVWGGELTDLGNQLIVGGSWLGWVGHVLVHANLLHLFGNMVFLWVFGNAVCAKLGNLVYPFVYFGLAALAMLVSTLIHPKHALGASAAINGVVGMFLIWYVLNEIRCWYFVWFFGLVNSGVLEVRSFWMILLWLGFDLWGTIRSGGNVDHIGHMAGLVIGIGLALFLLLVRWVEMDPGERSLLDLWSKDAPQGRHRRRRRGPPRRKVEKPSQETPKKQELEALPMIGMPEDPRIQTATAEARRRWPEFVHAFEHRRPEQKFAVKVVIRAGELTEPVWVTVLHLEDEIIHGKVDTEPVDVKTVKRGSRVRLKRQMVDDWFFLDDGQRVGGFTLTDL